ncbi:MAG TPA: DNA internalization-related competence protein ComEC/Rec2, partial [Gemmatimonadaceae bacterium]|nr:DNA internalization-related competence protein ComEC/Rec2 [Gemmatimonadaceae bacterium]
ATRRQERRCTEGAATMGRWTVRLTADAEAAAVTRGVLALRGCAVRVTLFVRSGAAPDGARVFVRGEARGTPRGLVIADARLLAVRPPGPMARMRARATAAVDSAFRGDAPFARALLLADMRDLTPAVRERWGASGLVHMLSVSGLHVGLLAGAVLLALRALRLRPAAAECAGLALVAGYVLLIGAPPPAVRAAAMLAASAASRVLQRPTSPWAILAVGALHPVVRPRVAVDLGWQLSVVGIVALAASGALAGRLARSAPARRRYGEHGLVGWRRELLAGMLTSTLATIVTLPFTAPVFGRVSVVAPLTNLLAAPLMAAAQPTLFLALALAPAPGLARLAADAAHPLLAALDGVAALGARVPGATMIVPSTAPAAVLLAGIAGGALAACLSDRPRRGVGCALLALAALPWLPLLPRRGTWAELHLLDVGQGDAVALRSGRGRWVLIDAGRSWRGGDAGASTVLPYLRRAGGPLVAAVITHAHADHVGGMATVVRAMRPRVLFDPAFVAPGGAYRAALRTARASGTEWRRVRPGDSLVVDDLVLGFVAPDSAWAASLHNPNDASTVVMARVGAVRFLLTGDAERGEEEWLMARGAALRADVLKVAHHGSVTSSTDAWLDAVRPRVALVSVGALNEYGHPSLDRLRAMASRGASVLRTDRLGTIVMRTDGRRLTVQVDGEEWELPDESRPP